MIWCFFLLITHLAFRRESGCFFVKVRMERLHFGLFGEPNSKNPSALKTRKLTCSSWIQQIGFIYILLNNICSHVVIPFLIHDFIIKVIWEVYVGVILLT